MLAELRKCVAERQSWHLAENSVHETSILLEELDQHIESQCKSNAH